MNTTPPFPQRLNTKVESFKASEFVELFSKVQINIPLLDAIKQVSTYGKFRKDLCTVKRRVNVKKSAYIAAHAKSVILNETPPKYKEPLLSYFIGKHNIDRALLDLGASVNLLPY